LLLIKFIGLDFPFKTATRRFFTENAFLDLTQVTQCNQKLAIEKSKILYENSATLEFGKHQRRTFSPKNAEQKSIVIVNKEVCAAG
jgi:hypothetical protein